MAAQHKIIFIILISTSLCQSYNSYTFQARKWIADSLSGATQEELELTANFFYWSFYRSHTTLKAQQACEEAFDTMWESWLSVSKTRLNPSKKSNNSEPSTITSSATQFAQACKEHRKAGLIYVACAEEMIKQGCVSPQLKISLQNIRQQARKAIYTGLANAVLRSTSFIDEEEQETPSAFDLLTMLKSFWHDLPRMTVISFVDFDTKYTQLSDSCWQSFMTAHKKANALWTHIEQARISFYGAYYLETINYINKNYPAMLPLKITFDRHGFIPQEERIHLLPKLSL